MPDAPCSKRVFACEIDVSHHADQVSLEEDAPETAELGNIGDQHSVSNHLILEVFKKMTYQIGIGEHFVESQPLLESVKSTKTIESTQESKAEDACSESTTPI